jgi:GNAT superfamily N-acetyltransferase
MSDAAIRKLTSADADQALILYNELTAGPQAHNPAVFDIVIGHPGTSVTGAFVGSDVLAMATLHLLPNVLWDARPYALIENVVTRASFQRQGYGRQVMDAVVKTAWDADAYKIMLMTGSARGAVGFYENIGFSAHEKHAMILRR